MPGAAVSVLIMAKSKKNKKDNAGDVLFGRLGRNSAKKKESAEVDEFLSNEAYELDEQEEFDSIDVTGAGEESDSDLDINELLRKYMPEYSEDDQAAGGSGVLSRLKQTKADNGTPRETDSSDDKLISALDSVFSRAVTAVEEAQDESAEELPETVEFADELADDISESAVTAEAESVEEILGESFEDGMDEFPDETVKKRGRKKSIGLFDGKNRRKEEEELISEYEFENEEESVTAEEAEVNAETDELTDKLAEEPVQAFSNEFTAEEEELFQEKPQKKRFGFGFGKKKKDKGGQKPDDAAAAVDEEEFLDVPDEITEGDDADDAALELTDESTDADLMVPAAEVAAEGGGTEEKTEADAEDVTEIRLDLGEEVQESTADASAEDFQETAEEGEEEFEELIDSTDMNLMIAFGLDGKKGDKKADRAKELGDRLEAKQHSRDQKKVKLDRPEFVDKTQTPKIRKEFKHRTIALWLKLGLCVSFTVLLMAFENIEVLSKLFTGTTKQFGGAFDPAVYPTVYIMVSLQLMLLACLCAYEQIADGFKFLFRGTPKPETMLSVMTVIGILDSVILVRVNSGEPVMFNFMVALTAVFTLVYAIYNHKREMLNFRIVANKKPKHIVRRLPDEESEGEARAFEDNDEVCDVMKIEKTDFIDGFFGRLSKPDAATTRFMVALLSAIGAIAVLFGILMNFRGGEADAVLGAVYASLLIVAPLSIYITFSYPFYRANVAAKEYDSAIIGDASLEEYSNASIISFDDKNVFPSYSVKVQNIRIYNNARIDRVLYYAASVFAYAGGPLQDVFEIATVEMGHSANVRIFDTENGFLATQVDGVNITFGSYEVLKKRGLYIPASAAEDDVDLSDELSIMYMFREDKLVAKMYVKYVMDADIDLILKQFAGSGLYVCVRTFDPNIDERMIARKLNMKRIPLRIVRYASAEEVTSYEEKVDSGLVTCGSPKSLLQVISYCEKVLRTRKTNIALSVLSVMIGAAILTLLLLSDSMGLLNSLYIAIYQLIWLIPLAISSRMFIR